MAEVQRNVHAGELAWQSFEPLDLDIPLHVVSTDDGLPVDLDEVERFVWQGAA